MINEETNPEKCIGCGSMEEWINHPDGTSATPMGHRPNAEFIEHAKRICPGVQVVISRDLEPLDIIKTSDSYVLPLSGLEFLCNYYERAFGDKR
jgi:hypothetical protein